jgi:hypothetical protein
MYGSKALGTKVRRRAAGEEAPMVMSTLEWQLHQVPAGAEVVLVDAERHPVARGIVSRDRRTLYGPNGEQIVVAKLHAPGIKVVPRESV